eukprot:scaffold23921_cov52-Phaeocystis_antarctica.AAC.3
MHARQGARARVAAGAWEVEARRVEGSTGRRTRCTALRLTRTQSTSPTDPMAVRRLGYSQLGLSRAAACTLLLAPFV